jgi:hypothetical protein
MDDLKDNTSGVRHHPQGNGFSAGKISRWIGGMLLAGVLTLGVVALVMHPGDSPDLNRLTPFQYWVVYLAVPSVALGLFVFWPACSYPPTKRTRAAW